MKSKVVFFSPWLRYFFVKNQKSFQRKKTNSWVFVSLDIMLGGGFEHFLFSPLFGEDSHFD